MIDRAFIEQHYKKEGAKAYRYMVKGAGEEVAQAACIIVMGLVTQDIRILASVTGYDRDEVRKYVARARDVGIYAGDLWVGCKYFEKSIKQDGRIICLLLDAMFLAQEINHRWETAETKWLYNWYEDQA